MPGDLGTLMERVEILGEWFAQVSFEATRLFDLPCVYLMVQTAAGGVLRVYYAGQTYSLRERYSGHHQLAPARELGATHALVLVARDLRDRLELETLLRWHFRPPLNAQEIPTPMRAWQAAMHCGKAKIAARAKSAHFSRV
jgi:hypothetical protein